MSVTPFGLSELQREVLNLVAEGNSGAEIARQLWKSDPTIRYHLQVLKRYFGVESLPEVLEKARLWDMLPEAL